MASVAQAGTGSSRSRSGTSDIDNTDMNDNLISEMDEKDDYTVETMDREQMDGDMESQVSGAIGLKGDVQTKLNKILGWSIVGIFCAWAAFSLSVAFTAGVEEQLGNPYSTLSIGASGFACQIQIVITAVTYFSYTSLAMLVPVQLVSIAFLIFMTIFECFDAAFENEYKSFLVVLMALASVTASYVFILLRQFQTANEVVEYMDDFDGEMIGEGQSLYSGEEPGYSQDQEDEGSGAQYEEEESAEENSSPVESATMDGSVSQGRSASRSGGERSNRKRGANETEPSYRGESTAGETTTGISASEGV